MTSSTWASSPRPPPHGRLVVREGRAAGDPLPGQAAPDLVDREGCVASDPPVAASSFRGGCARGRLVVLNRRRSSCGRLFVRGGTCCCRSSRLSGALPRRPGGTSRWRSSCGRLLVWKGPVAGDPPARDQIVVVIMLRSRSDSGRDQILVEIRFWSRLDSG